MKKILLFILVVWVQNISAQTYQKMLADSVTEFNVMNDRVVVRMSNPNQTSGSCFFYANADIWYAKTDSLYKGKKYKKIYQATFVTSQGLIREDTTFKKVYFIPYCDTLEVLLYNFSLLQGDTIKYVFPNGGGMMHDGVFTVDSIRIKHDYKHYYRKHFYLRNHPAQDSTLELIEGVGSVNHPLFLFHMFDQGFLTYSFPYNSCLSTNFDNILTCKLNNGAKVHYDSCAYSSAINTGCYTNPSDTCSFYTSNTCFGQIIQNRSLEHIMLSPNPTTGKFTIETTSTEKQSIQVFDLNGRLVLNQIINRSTEIDAGTLDNGIYTIAIKNGLGVINKKLVIAK